LCSQSKTMKKITLLTSFIFIALIVNAQTKISGIVKDNKGKIITGASISIKNAYDGTVSDSTGAYSFKTYEKANQTIVIKSLGYKTVEQVINIASENLNLNFSLKEEINELSAVTVTAGSFEASDKKRASVVLSSIDIVTTASANADVTAAVKTLPGAQQVGEQEGLFVRGGTAAETRVFIDGTAVNNFFFSSVPDIAQRGRFSPFLFKGTIFSSGGYSALYGQALSGALILESIDLPERSEASLGITSVGFSGGFQQLAKNKKSSWGLQVNNTNLKLYFDIVKQKPDYFQVPNFNNLEANFRFKTKKGGMIKYYTYLNDNKLGLRNRDIDSIVYKNAFGLTNFNWYNNISWKENLGNGWKFNTGISFSTNTDKINFELQDNTNQKVVTTNAHFGSKTFAVKAKGAMAQAKVVFEKRLSGINMLRFGAEHWYNKDETNFTNQYVTNAVTTVEDHLTAAFAETDFYLTNDIALKAGTRLENSSLLKKLNVAPRLSLAYKVAKNVQASAAYGIFYQKPASNILMFNPDLTYSKATHYIANIQKTTREQTFRAEIFYKKYDNLIKTFPDTTNNGNGEAAGFEIFWRDKKTIKNLDYWISYSYLDTRRNHNNFPTALEPSFAAKHTLNIVAKKFVLPWKTGFNATYTVATGRPYYNFINNNGKVEIADRGRTIPFHNIGFSLNYLPNLGKKNPKFFPIIVASVTNVFNFKQEFGFNYNYRNTIKQAITPPAPQFFFIGCFISMGVDRTEDVINNNL